MMRLDIHAGNKDTHMKWGQERSVLFCSVLFCSVLFCSVLFCSVLFCSCFPPIAAIRKYISGKILAAAGPHASGPSPLEQETFCRRLRITSLKAKLR